MQQSNQRILVAIPCYNEETTIGKVIDDFKRELPMADVLVVDNNSTDKTAAISAEKGAKVVCEKKQGKGYAVQRIFDECRHDLLVMVDGDDTYLASDVHKLLEIVANGEAEMAVGNRIHSANLKSFSASHWWGNKMLTRILNTLFRTNLKDLESGFRVIHKNFVRSSALLAGGFGIEPELVIQAMEKGFRIKEVPISIKKRGDNSHSKLNTFRDGTIVLYTILSLFRDYKPLQLFATVSLVLLLVAAGLGWYSIRDYIVTGIVYHIPALFVAGFFALASFVSFIAGLILSSIKRKHDELLVIITRNK